jgi:hypothetical protein
LSSWKTPLSSSVFLLLSRCRWLFLTDTTTPNNSHYYLRNPVVNTNQDSQTIIWSLIEFQQFF